MSRTLFAIALLLAAATAAPVNPGADIVPEEEMVQTNVKTTILSQATNADDFSEDSNADFAKMIGGPAAAGSETADAEAAEASADLADKADETEVPDIPPPIKAATGAWSKPAAGKPEFSYEFQPDFNSLAKPPPVTGSQSAYLSKAGNAKQAQVLAEDKEIAAEEQAAALKQAEADSEKAREVQALSQAKSEVKTLMNTAAAAAAAYKTSKQFHDEEVKKVEIAEEAAAAQAKVVHEAEMTLEHQKAILAVKDKEVGKAKQDEMHARFKAEYKGHQYTKARDSAIKADNDYRQTEHEEVKKQKFREVAEKAVAKEAQREAKEEKEDAAAAKAPYDWSAEADAPLKDGSIGAKVVPTKKKSIVKKAVQAVKAVVAAKEGCEDCTELPDIYTNAGGSCNDCSEWARKGQCDLEDYKDFMAQYCAKSCGCKLAVPAAATTALVSMPPKLKKH